MTVSLEELNTATDGDFVSAVGDVFENAPWVAGRTAPRRPFDSVTALHAAMMQTIAEAGAEERLAFLRGHPELAGKVARAGAMTGASIAEQGSLGLDRLSDAEFARFEALNDAYRSRFGFPFIICVRRHTRDSILRCFARRLENDAAAEEQTAITEIGFISRLRLAGKATGAGMPVTTGRLSTHVLDTVAGRPAAGVLVSLHEIGASATADLVSVRTNRDGRTDAPLIANEPLRIGTYELRFHVGDYFARTGCATADPPFLDVVPVRFAIAEPEAHYHVPLLVSPWTYTTYRGS
ncbi:MAG: 2-oxo-4-hydroxy-4-carboxy-5-ureidoimidazoline decarboxylase [Acetobacteraceae bacterium]